MKKNEYVIRLETPADYPELDVLVREAFWNVYRPGCLEHYLLRCLRKDQDFVPELAFVMQKDGRIIGQNVFVRACIHGDDGRRIPIMTMGPICIAPEYWRQGYGKLLLDETMEYARRAGAGALCLEGNIAFYGKSGFRHASEFGIRYHGLQEGEDTSFFLCRELIPGYLDGVAGEYSPPKAYFVDETEAEIFDRQFAPKEKKRLPGQLV